MLKKANPETGFAFRVTKIALGAADKQVVQSAQVKYHQYKAEKRGDTGRRWATIAMTNYRNTHIVRYFPYLPASSIFSGSVEVSVITEISGGLKSLNGIRGTEPLVESPRVM